MKRREFIQNSVFTAASLVALPSFLVASKAKTKIGLQLYTLRDTINNNPKEILKQVAGFGYKELETYSYADGKIFGMPFQDFVSCVRDFGMEVTSGHYPLGMASGDQWKKAVEDAKKARQPYMVVPWIEENERKSIDDYKRICETLNKAGEVTNQHGIRFGYHNHAFEFEALDGQVPFDLMLKECDPKLVSMELDLYWVYRAGYDPVTYFKNHPGRFEQWHVKDMDPTNKERNADIGTGTIDFRSLFEHAKLSGLKHFYVEQETYPGKPIDSVQASIANLKKLL
ncbi:MAG TPA: sugar phosphate isomerase/epimerase family protein [Chryseosolibacter sp.]|nr:sugar phosphate isomerase/epimerase family protein [Chryseosolibacter sp.]